MLVCGDGQTEGTGVVASRVSCLALDASSSASNSSSTLHRGTIGTMQFICKNKNNQLVVYFDSIII